MRVQYAIVFVADMQASTAFYRDIMGLQLRFATPEWTEFETAGATLALHRADASTPARDGEVTAMAGRCRPGLSVPDLDVFHERMTGSEVPCVQAPVAVFGTRIAQYRDPDGLVISVSERKSGS